jgi:hypothetical protein
MFAVVCNEASHYIEWYYILVSRQIRFPYPHLSPTPHMRGAIDSGVALERWREWGFEVLPTFTPTLAFKSRLANCKIRQVDGASYTPGGRPNE